MTLVDPMRAGIKLESETVGDGREVTRGDTVTVAYELSLNRGDVVQSIDSFAFTLGKRDVIAALEYGVDGMRVGGRRRFRAGPHLAYRDVGVDGVVPPNAVLIFDLKLLSVTRDSG
jgi:FKBP-type peptidyl-prolyl cis-trans isomerase